MVVGAVLVEIVLTTMVQHHEKTALRLWIRQSYVLLLYRWRRHSGRCCWLESESALLVGVHLGSIANNLAVTAAS